MHLVLSLKLNKTDNFKNNLDMISTESVKSVCIIQIIRSFFSATNRASEWSEDGTQCQRTKRPGDETSRGRNIALFAKKTCF